jgi:hypothetical protein
MGRLAVTIALGGLLSGCGGESLSADAVAVRDLCVANAGEAQYCTCVATTLEDQMAPEAFASMARGGEGSELLPLLEQIAKADASCGGQAK